MSWLSLAQTSTPANVPVEVKSGEFTPEKFNAGMAIARQSCEQQLPYPVVPNVNPYNPKDIQVCKRLEIRGKRMECEINNMSRQFVGGASLTELKNWNQCVGKIAILLQDGYYIAASEIDRRQKICNDQFFRDPGDSPKLGYLERLRKEFSRPDYAAPEKKLPETALFDRSAIRVDDQKAGLLKCEYLNPPEPAAPTPPPGPKLDPGVVPVPNPATPRPIDPNTAKKAEPKKPVNKDSQSGSGPKKVDPKEKSKSNMTPPVGECKRPKLDCPVPQTPVSQAQLPIFR